MSTPLHLWRSMRDTWLYRHEPENLRKLADAYWRALLIGAAFAFIGLVAYSGAKFYELFEEGRETSLLSSGGGILLDPDDLRAMLEAVDARRAQYESVKKNPPKIADPSQ